MSENYFFGKPIYLNIGGGFFSLMPNFLKDQFQEDIPSFSQYLELLNNLSRKSNCKLLVEPGALLVSTSMRFYTKVVSIDTLSSNTYIQVDGSIYDIQPTKSNKQLPFNVIAEGVKTITGRVVGFTGMEDDILVDEFSHELSLGDWLEFTNVGAYSQTLRPSFISSPKPIISFENDTLSLVRKKASHQDLFSQWL
jgi:diaminopimelate decarboxylase